MCPARLIPRLDAVSIHDARMLRIFAVRLIQSTVIWAPKMKNTGSLAIMQKILCDQRVMDKEQK